MLYRHFISGTQQLHCKIMIPYIGHPSDFSLVIVLPAIKPILHQKLVLVYTCTAAIAGHSSTLVATYTGVTPDSTRYEHSLKR